MATDFQTQLAKLRLRKEVLIIMVFVLVIAVLWIGLSVFSSQQQTGITPEQRQLAQPLTPVLDLAVIERLEQKRVYGSEELSNFPLFVVEAERNSNQFGNASSVPDPSGSSVVLPEDLEGDLEQAEQPL